MAEDTGRRGVSKEAWAAIGAISAALITGVVTLLTYVIPSDHQPSRAASDTPAPASASASTDASGGTTATLRAMAGRWQGTARDSAGAVFQVAVEITAPCEVDKPCGTIGVSHVPCYGQISLVGVEDDEVEFRVANFTAESNQQICQPGAGEHFRLRPDGRLAYRTTYEPIANGTLNRQ
ncbi:MAG TPA: hypothetical protein VGO94_02805 [Mycobacteriales bacterium]|nr:hypothetical protein [Mycobacteriales bacterium]